MRAIARLAFDIRNEALGRQRREHTLVVHFEDVHLLGIEHARHVEQRSRPILQLDAQPRQSSRSRQIAQQYVSEQPRIDVAAAQDDADRPSGEPARIREQGGKADAPAGKKDEPSNKGDSSQKGEAGRDKQPGKPDAAEGKKTDAAKSKDAGEKK